MTNNVASPPPARRLALLIDGDNVSATLLDKILSKTNEHGLVTIKRIYGDWTRPALNGWRTLLHDHAARPIQQFQYTTGKNATDCALIIDAMDILYSNRVDGFCLAASDSDYTRLAIRICEQGLFMMGIGGAQTPRAFVNACSLFFYTSELEPSNEAASDETAPTAVNGNGHGPSVKGDDPLPLIKQAFASVVENGGWAKLSRLASQVRQLEPRFDVRNFGHKQFSHLLKAYPETFRLQYRSKRNITVKLLQQNQNGNGKSSSTQSDSGLSMASLKQAFGKAVQEKGWINLEVIRMCLSQIEPNMDTANLTAQDLSRFVKAHPEIFEIKSGVNGRNQANMYVRLKQLTIH